jgi:large subunit ribosomal protein L7/L12
MPITQDQFIEWVKALNATRLKGFVEALEDELDVKAPRAAPVRQEATPPPAVEPTHFDVVLTAVGDQKIKVIRAVRELTGLGLREARDAVDAAPAVVKEAVDAEQAEAVIAALVAAGASAERRPVAP